MKHVYPIFESRLIKMTPQKAVTAKFIEDLKMNPGSIEELLYTYQYEEGLGNELDHTLIDSPRI